MFAGLTLQVLVAGALMRPSRLEMSAKVAQRKHLNHCDRRKFCEIDILKNISLFLVGIGSLLFNIGIFIVYLHFPEYALSHAATEAEVSWCFSISGICSSIGRILLGLATNSDTVDENLVFFGSYVLLGICTVGFPLFISMSSLRNVYMAILGIYNGACYVVVNSIVLNLVGPKQVAQGTGYIMAFIGLGTLIGPPLGGTK